MTPDGRVAAGRWRLPAAMDAMPERYEAPLAMARVLHQLDQKPLTSQAFEQAMTLAGRVQVNGAPNLPAEVAHRMGQYLLELGDNVAAVQVLRLALLRLGQQPAALQVLTASLQHEA